MEDKIITNDSEKDPIVSIIPASALKQMALLKDLGEEFSKEQLLRITRIYFPKAYKRATGYKKEQSVQKKLPEIKMEASIIAVLSMVAAKSLGVSVKTLTSVSKIEEVVLQGTGITALVSWLDKNKKDKDNILDASGKRRLVELLTELKFTVETQEYFFSFEKLKRTVADLNEWLKIVAALNKNAATQPHFLRLASSSGSGVVWRKEKIYMSLIIGITLGRERASFSISDILQLCKIIKEDSWVKDIKEKLSLIIIDDLKGSLADISSIQNIIDEMNLFRNKTIFFYAKKILWGKSDEEGLIRDADVLFTSGALAIGRFTGRKFDEAALKEIRKKISSSLGNQPMTFSYQFITEYPYLITWFTEQEFFRMAIIDQFKDKKLQAIADTYGVGEAFKKCVTYINKTVTVADVVMDIINSKEVFGTSLNFFTKNKSMMSNRKLAPSDVRKKRLYKTVMNHASRVFTPRAFSDWMYYVESRDPDVAVDLAGIAVSHIAAAYLMTTTEKRALTITNFIEGKPWGKYIDENAKEYFKAKIGTVNQISNKKTSSRRGRR
jgi:hypothetical protein